MYGWSFAARTVDEVGLLLRALGKHRYLAEVDHRLHWAVDATVAVVDPTFEGAVARFAELRIEHPDLDLRSRDPALWRAAPTDEVIAALAALWDPGARGERCRVALRQTLRDEGIGVSEHQPFQSDADEPPHPELVLLDWVLLPVDELDTERHAGALRAMADTGEDVNPSEPSHLEGPTLSEVELCDGCPRGVLPTDFMVWADGPYRYCDYVFRGASRAAKLVDPPVGYRDIDEA